MVSVSLGESSIAMGTSLNETFTSWHSSINATEDPTTSSSFVGSEDQSLEPEAILAPSADQDLQNGKVDGLIDLTKVGEKFFVKLGSFI